MTGAAAPISYSFELPGSSANAQATAQAYAEFMPQSLPEISGMAGSLLQTLRAGLPGMAQYQRGASEPMFAPSGAMHMPGAIDTPGGMSWSPQGGFNFHGLPMSITGTIGTPTELLNSIQGPWIGGGPPSADGGDVAPGGELPGPGPIFGPPTPNNSDYGEARGGSSYFNGQNFGQQGAPGPAADSRWAGVVPNENVGPGSVPWAFTNNGSQSGSQYSGLQNGQLTGGISDSTSVVPARSWQSYLPGGDPPMDYGQFIDPRAGTPSNWPLLSSAAYGQPSGQDITMPWGEGY